MAVTNQFKATLFIILFVVLFGLIFLAFEGMNVRVGKLEKAQLPQVQRVMEVVTATPSPTATPAAQLRTFQKVVTPTRSVGK